MVRVEILGEFVALKGYSPDKNVFVQLFQKNIILIANVPIYFARILGLNSI